MKEGDGQFGAGQADANGRIICGAKCKSTGAPCVRSPVRGRTRCRVHGGAVPRGPESPNWKDGRQSKYPLPKSLAAFVERMAEETDALSLLDALVHTRAVKASVMARWVQVEEQGALTPEDAALVRSFSSDVIALQEHERKLVESWSRVLHADTVPVVYVVAMMVEMQRLLIEVLNDSAEDRAKLARLLAWLDLRMGASQARTRLSDGKGVGVSPDA